MTINNLWANRPISPVHQSVVRARPEQTSRLRWLACALVCASVCAKAQGEDVVRIVNRLRAPGGACSATATPLVPQSALDAVAASLANGVQLDPALASSGYRLTEVQVISLSGEGLDGPLATLLAREFCAQIGMPRLSEIGVYLSSNQLWIVLGAPFAPSAGLTRQMLAERMLALVNQARNCGARFMPVARSVGWNAVLEKASAGHAADMAAHSYFSHTGLDASTPAQRLVRAGYCWRSVGENIASGQGSPEQVVAGWLASPEHCTNPMNDTFTEMGAAFSVNDKSRMGIYWVQLFATPG